MSTYAVFGMTPSRAREMAGQAVSHLVDGQPIPESRWLELVADKAAEIMKSDLTVRLSDKFDAPTFAKQFRDLAERQGGRNLHVKAWTKSICKDQYGRPKMVWVNVDMTNVA